MADFDANNTKEKVVAIIAQKLNIDPTTVTPASTLADLGADSLDLVEIVVKLEDQFGIEIDDEKAESMKNVGEVIEYVNSVRSK